ncbi:MAG: GIY-YIG nuclease family protein, partial [Phycisphaeraceae bacterium]
LSALDIPHAGTHQWGVPVASTRPGIYIISLCPGPDSLAALPSAPIDLTLIERWIGRVPRMVLDRQRPTISVLAEYLRSFWLPDEPILYIGTATSLRSRLNQFVNHTLGDRAPHKGGHWLKTLNILDELHIHYAVATSPDHALDLESRAIRLFSEHVSDASRANLPRPEVAIPFANMRDHIRRRKQSRLRHQFNPRIATG